MKIQDLNPKVIRDLVRLLSICIVVFMLTTAVAGSMLLKAKAENERLKERVEQLESLVIEGIVEADVMAATLIKAPRVPQYVTVEKGDWLSKYAKWYLGDAKRWPEIWKLNPHIKNPDLIYPGQRVRIY